MKLFKKRLFRTQSLDKFSNQFEADDYESQKDKYHDSVKRRSQTIDISKSFKREFEFDMKENNITIEKTKVVRSFSVDAILEDNDNITLPPPDYPSDDDDVDSRERSVAQARASVMIYNNEVKKWEHAGGAQGMSRVHVYFNPSNDSYRIVGRKVNDNEVVINCVLGKTLKYNKATATFHQWRDQRQVYGLNFSSADDATIFSEAVLGAVENLNHPQDPPPESSQHNGHAGTQYQRFQEDPYRQPQPQVQHNESPRQPVLSQPPKAPEPPRSVPQPPQPPVVPNIPPSTPALPPASGPPLAGGAPPPPPPPPPPPMGGGGPPAPPSPPSGGAGLANALQGVTLKKKSEITEERRPLPPANPMDDMMSALNKKLLARKKMADGSEDSTSSSNNAAAPPTVTKSVVPPPTLSKTPASNKSPVFTKPSNVVTQSNKFPRANSISMNASSSSDDLQSLKEEIMQCVREEIQAAKDEIIEALRQELQDLK